MKSIHALSTVLHSMGLKSHSLLVKSLLKKGRSIINQNVPKKYNYNYNVMFEVGKFFNKVKELHFSDSKKLIKDKKSILENEKLLKQKMLNFYFDYINVMANSLEKSSILEDSSFSEKDILEILIQSDKNSFKDLGKNLLEEGLIDLNSTLYSSIDSFNHDLYHLVINKLSYKKFNLLKIEEDKYHLFDKLDEDIASGLSDRSQKTTLDERFPNTLVNKFLDFIKKHNTKLNDKNLIISELEKWKDEELGYIYSDQFLHQNKYYHFEKKKAFVDYQFQNLKKVTEDICDGKIKEKDFPLLKKELKSKIKNEEKEFFITLFDDEEDPEELTDKIYEWEYLYYEAVSKLVKEHLLKLEDPK